MRKALIVAALALGVASPARIALADPGHVEPRITVMRWAAEPVNAAPEDCAEACSEEILIVKAHDPDSSITEIQVDFGEGAPFVFAHTGCVQGREPGRRARLEIGVSYPAAGTYTVRAVAYSHRRCLGHERGDRHPQRHSDVVRLVTEVEPPEAAMSERSSSARA